MRPSIRVRLAAMMLLQYFVWGAWYVTVGTWLVAKLHFSAERAGLITGTTALGAIVAPLFVGLIADRAFAAQNILGALHLVGAVILAFASTQTRFEVLYICILCYSLLFMPTLALTNALAFRQMHDPDTQFGPIRVFGTLGWIVAGLLIGGLGIEATAMPLRLAAAASIFYGLYCFTLPNTPPGTANRSLGFSSVLPREALQVLSDRSMAVFAAASLLICIPLQFYYAFTNLFLNEVGVTNAAGKMTGGQFSELLCMLLIPWFFRKLGVKYMLGLGMLAWVVRYLMFAFGDANGLFWMLASGIVLHGICYDFFFVVGQIYIDRRATASLRAATQGLITLLTYGVGMFVGAWVSGLVVDAYSRRPGAAAVAHDWRSIWVVAAACSAIVFVTFMGLFKDRSAVANVRPMAVPL